MTDAAIAACGGTPDACLSEKSGDDHTESGPQDAGEACATVPCGGKRKEPEPEPETESDDAAQKAEAADESGTPAAKKCKPDAPEPEAETECDETTQPCETGTLPHAGDQDGTSA